MPGESQISGCLYRRASSLTVPSILSAMGVETAPRVRRCGGLLRAEGNFWIRNEGQLHFIYADFERRRRVILSGLQRAGDMEGFKAANKACELVRRQFARHGIAPRGRPDEPLPKQPARPPALLKSSNYRQPRRYRHRLRIPAPGTYPLLTTPPPGTYPIMRSLAIAIVTCFCASNLFAQAGQPGMTKAERDKLAALPTGDSLTSLLLGKTDASIVPNTAPSSGQILIGNGTAYAPHSVSGDVTLSNAGAVSVIGLRGVTIASGAATPSDGDILVYRTSSSGYTPEAKPAGGSNPAWGDITGTLSSQTDLQAALNAKVSTATTVNSHALSGNISLTASDVGAPSGSGTSSGTNTGDQDLSSYATISALNAALNAGNISYDNSASGLISTTVQAAIDEIAASSAGASLSGTNEFTAQNTFDKAPIISRTDLSGGTALTIGTLYTDSLSSARTLTFSGSPMEGSSTGVMLTVTNSPVLTIPSCKRIGDANTAITSLRMINGVHSLTWVYLGGGWKLFDSVGAQNNDTATTAPSVSDDQTTGYGVRSQWLDTTTGALYECTDASTGAAVWRKMTKRTSYLQFVAPHRVDGTGAVIQTSDPTATYYGQAKFSNSAAKTANWIEYRIIVPEDIDTAVDLRARFKFQLSATDTGKHRYEISMADVAASEQVTKTLSNAVEMDFTGDASGASGDIEGTGWVTLTSWKSSLTAGDLLVVRVARVGDDGTNDTSTVDSYSGKLSLEYTVAQ